MLGASDFGLINFPYLPTEITLFADAGLAWNSTDRFFDLLQWSEGRSTETFLITDDQGNQQQLDATVSRRVPVFSAGVSSRFNLFGYIVLEIFYAYPFQRPEKGAHFGFQLIPGW